MKDKLVIVFLLLATNSANAESFNFNNIEIGSSTLSTNTILGYVRSQMQFGTPNWLPVIERTSLYYGVYVRDRLMQAPLSIEFVTKEKYKEMQSAADTDNQRLIQRIRSKVENVKRLQATIEQRGDGARGREDGFGDRSTAKARRLICRTAKGWQPIKKVTS
jgi:hypothetical protein